MKSERKIIKISLSVCAGVLLAAELAGCHTAITPLKPAMIGPPWALPMPAAKPAPLIVGATLAGHVPPAAGRQPIAATGGTGQNWFANFPNGTTRTIHIARYRHIWRQSRKTIEALGFHINWQDHRLGIISTDPRLAPEVLQWWRPDTTSGSSLMESTLNTYRRIIRLVITRDKQPETFSITVEVLVQRRENPQGNVGNVAFVGPSAFGSNVLPLRASHAGVHTGGQFWMTIGRDTLLEKKVLKKLFKKI